MTTTLNPPAATINRDRWGRPLIIPPGGGKPIAYTRASTLGKVLEEQSALTAWKQRMTLIGASLQPHLMLAVSAARDDKTKMNDLAEQAMAAAQAGARAEVGTAIHKLTEIIDAGRDPGPYPADYKPDIDAYLAATAGWTYQAMETFVVCDELQTAGTFDRLTDRIVDLKTGRTVEYSGLSFAVQLAVYSHGSLYDPATGQRTPLEVDQQVGTVVHLPAGEGRCEVYDVDLHEGWLAACLAFDVRETRGKARRFLTPAKPAGPPPVTAEQLAVWIPQAPTVAALTDLWSQHSGMFTPELETAAAARFADLQST
jgi:hypothetical protein